MAANHLITFAVYHVYDIKIVMLRSDLTVQEYLKKHVSEFLAEIVRIAPVYGVACLVDFLQEVVPEALVCLLHVPRAVPAQYVYQIVEASSCLFGSLCLDI